MEKVKHPVDDARDASAEILAGGDMHHGLVYQPAVLWDPPRTCSAWNEESFGPVTAVVAANDLEEAIAIAHESDYGLSAGVLANDRVRGMTAARRIRCGAVHIGLHSFQSDSMAPSAALACLVLLAVAGSTRWSLSLN